MRRRRRSDHTPRDYPTIIHYSLLVTHNWAACPTNSISFISLPSRNQQFHYAIDLCYIFHFILLRSEKYQVYYIWCRKNNLNDTKNICTRVYPKVSGLAAWSENCKWYSSLPLGAVVSLLCVSLVSFANTTLCVASQRVFIVFYFFIDPVRKFLDRPSYAI
jgi:hypothetical protein